MTMPTTKLTIDVRKAFDAGIGTYIRQVVPRVLDRLGAHVQPTLLVPAGELEMRYAWLARPGLEFVPMVAAPLSVAEQLELRRCVEASSLFWATSLAHPVGRSTPMVATVYDVAQLALGRSAGVSTALAMAARILLSSQRRGALALMAISDFTRREFIRLVGAPQSGPIVVTPLGVDTSWFAAGQQRDARIARPYFVSVGSVRPHKNIERLVHAFAGVAEALPHALVVVGLDQMRGAHRQWLADLPQVVQSRIRFTGVLEEGELKALIAGADALVFPSLYEGFGLPALEAMAAGCPVLASSAASLPEVCGSAAAEMFDPYSIEQMADVLLRQARRTPTEFKAIVEEGRARAAGFTWDRTADLTAAVIERCIAQAGLAKLSP